MCANLQTDRGVCKGVSVYDDGEEGLSLSFNIVLLGHWAICECMELTAEAQSFLVHLPTCSAPTPQASLPLPAYPCLTDSSCCPVKLRHKRRHGPGCLSGAMSSSQSLCWWWALNRIEWRGWQPLHLTCPHHIQCYSYLHIEILEILVLLWPCLKLNVILIHELYYFIHYSFSSVCNKT